MGAQGDVMNLHHDHHFTDGVIHDQVIFEGADAQPPPSEESDAPCDTSPNPVRRERTVVGKSVLCPDLQKIVERSQKILGAIVGGLDDILLGLLSSSHSPDHIDDWLMLYDPKSKHSILSCIVSHKTANTLEKSLSYVIERANKEYLNAFYGEHGRTALQLAVVCGNAWAADLLLSCPLVDQFKLSEKDDSLLSMVLRCIRFQSPTPTPPVDPTQKAEANDPEVKQDPDSPKTPETPSPGGSDKKKPVFDLQPPVLMMMHLVQNERFCPTPLAIKRLHHDLRYRPEEQVYLIRLLSEGGRLKMVVSLAINNWATAPKQKSKSLDSVRPEDNLSQRTK